MVVGGVERRDWVPFGIQRTLVAAEPHSPAWVVASRASRTSIAAQAASCRNQPALAVAINRSRRTRKLKAVLVAAIEEACRSQSKRLVRGACHLVLVLELVMHQGLELEQILAAIRPLLVVEGAPIALVVS